MKQTHDRSSKDRSWCDLSRRTLLRAAGFGLAALATPRELLARLARPGPVVSPDWVVDTEHRFPYFQSTPVSYRHVSLQDTFWAPRQKATREVTLPWITKAHDSAGGLEAFKAHSIGYSAGPKVVNMEAIKFIEAMATVVGVQRDPAIEGLTDAWIKSFWRRAPTGIWKRISHTVWIILPSDARPCIGLMRAQRAAGIDAAGRGEETMLTAARLRDGANESMCQTVKDSANSSLIGNNHNTGKHLWTR